MMGKKSAFTESSSLSSETEEEFSLETSDLIHQRPPSSRWSFFAQIIKVIEKVKVHRTTCCFSDIVVWWKDRQSSWNFLIL